MKTLSWTTVDKSTWPAGPWHNEPDKLQWQDEATGFPCLIHRGPSGALCGYVAVSPGHSAYGKNYDDVGVTCHGGLTFASACQSTTDPSSGICHIVEPSEQDNVWWLGFDCAHLGDKVPYMPPYINSYGEVDIYRDIAYVQRECADLARQLKELS
jgi:hypothetical protein